MKKYYIGFFVLLAVCLGCLVYVVSQGASAKTDKATDKVVEQFSNKFDQFSYNGGALPVSLAAAGIKDAPSTVTYTKISGTKYKVCFDYKTAAGGFDAGWTAILLGGLGAGGQSSSDNNSLDNGSYFNSDVEFNHKKGENCQTVTYSNSGGGGLMQPDGVQTSNNSATGACDADTSQYKDYGSLSVSSVDTANQQINFSPDGQYVYDADYNQLPTITSLKYDSSTLFCDASLQPTTVSAVKAGGDVVIYLNSPTYTTLPRLDLY